jgi:predicted nucleotidyltransferase
MKEQIIQLKQIILNFFPTCEVLLFGSRSRKDYSESSDYDILVITKEELSIENKREYSAKIRKILAQQKIPVDIIIQSISEIKIKQNITGHIVKKALEEGVEL